MPKITKEVVQKVKEESKKVALEEHKITKEEEKLFEQALKEAKMPVELTDEDFKLGDYELDIRKLSLPNQLQMVFRTMALVVVYLRQLSQNQVDQIRLLMLELKKMGVEDIEKSLSELLVEMQNKNKNKQTTKN